MALVVFLRGVNVGGHRVFRPTGLMQHLRRYDPVNIGAAGTFVVHGRVSQTALRAAIARALPFAADIMICEGRDLLRLTRAEPLPAAPADRSVVPFVSVLARLRRPSSPLPLRFPASGPWEMKLLGQLDRFVYGVYRRQMRAVSHLAQVDRVFGVPATTRSWSTMLKIAAVVKRPRD
jgi:uncharacterized protein (DUF1697 family)